MKVSVAPRGQRQSVLVFGPPKTGKTQIVSELSKSYNLIWFDLENGHATLFKLPQEAQERIELISLPDTRSYPIAIETCLKVIKGGPVSICETHGKVDCALCKKANAPVTLLHLNLLGPDTIVVFDSLTQLTNSAISHITKDKADDYKLQFEDWGNLGKLMDIFLSHVQQAKFNVVCISHETEVELEDGKMKLVPTAGTRNFSRNTAKYFGHCIYASVANMKHKFQSSTTSTVNVMVGSRTDIKTEKMDEPSLASIFAPDTTVRNQVASNGGGVQSVKSEPERVQSVASNSNSVRSSEPAGLFEQRNTEATRSGTSDTIQSNAPTNGEIAASKLTGLAARLAAKKAGG